MSRYLRNFSINYGLNNLSSVGTVVEFLSVVNDDHLQLGKFCLTVVYESDMVDDDFQIYLASEYEVLPDYFGGGQTKFLNTVVLANERFHAFLLLPNETLHRN